MKYINEITVSVLFILILIMFLDPIMVLMPSQTVYFLMAGIIVLFGIFAGLVWREKALDERDEFHKMLSGRMGYLLGASVLLLGLLVQSSSGHADPWLVLGLGAMVIGKMAGRFWSRINY